MPAINGVDIVRYLMVFAGLSIVIIIHELGHFIAARRGGIPIAIFSIGLGPALWRRRFGETEFRIAWIPFGGYVLPKVDQESDFLQYSLTKRTILAAGGPIASLIFPWFCYIFLGVLKQGFNPEIIWNAGIKVFTVAYAMLRGLGLAITHPQALSGVIGIVSEGGRLVGTNLLRGLELSAMLSINLGLFNLIPLPALDGGKILLNLLEKVHPKLRRLQEPLAIAGWVCIILLMLYVTVLDIGKYIVGPLMG